MNDESSMLVKPAFKRLIERYDAAKAPYHISTRPYFSVGAIRFERYGDAGSIAGAVRTVLRAPPQEIELFSYNFTDQKVAALGGRDASEADTNQDEAHKTLDEDFAIEGLSATSLGVRMKYAETALGDIKLEFANLKDDFIAGVLDGTAEIEDPSAILVPPEIGSPLTLERMLFSAIAPKAVLIPAWNRKAEEPFGTLDQCPEGGGKSYLRANGEPTHHNFWRLPEGEIWERNGAAHDTKYSVLVKIQRPVYVIVAEPGLLVANNKGVKELDLVWLEFKLRLHGHAFYYPSENA